MSWCPNGHCPIENGSKNFPLPHLKKFSPPLQKISPPKFFQPLAATSGPSALLAVCVDINSLHSNQTSEWYQKIPIPNHTRVNTKTGQVVDKAWGVISIFYRLPSIKWTAMFGVENPDIDEKRKEFVLLQKGALWLLLGVFTQEVISNIHSNIQYSKFLKILLSCFKTTLRISVFWIAPSDQFGLCATPDFSVSSYKPHETNTFLFFSAFFVKQHIED